MSLENFNIENAVLRGLKNDKIISPRYIRMPVDVECTIFSPLPMQCIHRVVNILRDIDDQIVSGETVIKPEMVPSWFLSKFQPTPTRENIDNRLRQIRTADSNSRLKLMRENWDFDGWSYWILPEERQWFIKSLEPSRDAIIVRLAVPGMPAPLGALEILLVFCGAEFGLEIMSFG
jgi:hypothetical protein